MAVHREVDVAVEEGLFDFFGEEPLAFHLVKATFWIWSPRVFSTTTSTVTASLQ